MREKLIVLLLITIFSAVYGVCLADKGPAEMVLQAEKDKADKPKPAVFPHAKHQETFACAECHHSAEDNKQVPYSEGMEIQKCESCHFKGSDMPKKLDSFKNAAHENCKSCHKEVVSQRPELKEKFKGCLPCHEKT